MTTLQKIELALFFIGLLVLTGLAHWVGNYAPVKDYLAPTVTTYVDTPIYLIRDYSDTELDTVCADRFSIEEMIRLESAAAGLTHSEADRLVSIARCESKLVSTAKNPNSSAAGIFQLLSSTQSRYGVTNPYDPRQNIRAAVRLYQVEGLNPWRECLI